MIIKIIKQITVYNFKSWSRRKRYTNFKEKTNLFSNKKYGRRI